MRIGLFLAYWPWFSLEEQVELAALGDELGLDSVWISEAGGQDAVSVRGLGAGRDGRGLARRHLRRALPARPRRVRTAGVGGVVRRAVRQAARAHPRVRR